MPIIVSRVAPNTPADLCIPRLNEGDQVLFINGRDVSQHTHEQVHVIVEIVLLLYQHMLSISLGFFSPCFSANIYKINLKWKFTYLIFTAFVVVTIDSNAAIDVKQHFTSN